MRHTASEVLNRFVESDLQVIPKKMMDTPKKRKFQRKFLMRKMKRKLKNDPNFNLSVREICKFGWDGAFRKQTFKKKI
jgi:hypothetical protein